MSYRTLAAAGVLGLASMGVTAGPASGIGVEAGGRGVEVTINEFWSEGYTRVLVPINTPAGTRRVCTKGIN